MLMHIPVNCKSNLIPISYMSGCINDKDHLMRSALTFLHCTIECTQQPIPSINAAQAQEKPYSKQYKLPRR